MVIKLTLPEGQTVFTGKQIIFKAPCHNVDTDILSINNTEYTLVDCCGNGSAEFMNMFTPGAMVSVILDEEQKLAYLQSVSGGTKRLLQYNSYPAHQLDLSFFEFDCEYCVKFRDFVLPSVISDNTASESLSFSCVNHYIEGDFVGMKMFQLNFRYDTGQLTANVYDLDFSGNIFGSEDILQTQEWVYFYKK